MPPSSDRDAAIESALADRGVTCSIGTSLFGLNRRRAMLAADEALYAAKHAGRNAIEIAVQ